MTPTDNRPTAMTLAQVQAVLDAESPTAGVADVRFSSVSTDSRTLQQGDLFFALQGPRFDGHRFLAQAERAGAAAAIVSRFDDSVSLPQLRVDDTLAALGLLAAWWRRQQGLPIVGITGSNGKTTVKEMLASILCQRSPVLVTRGNLNNEIGVPLTLLGLTPEHRYAVVEMGASGPGDIAYLTQIVQPDVAMITNVAPAHLEGFGDIATVARAKGEIFSGLSADGVAVLNADESRVGIWRVMTANHRTVSFALRNPADVSAELLDSAGHPGCHFMLHTPAGKIRIELALVGRHNVMNALAAAAAALALEIPLTDIQAGLEAMRPVDGRLAAVSGVHGVRLINDTYNANPGSLCAALDVLATSSGQKILVLGDMGELGNAAAALHEQVGRQARVRDIDRLYTVGDFAGLAAGTFGHGGYHFATKQALIEGLLADLAADAGAAGSTVLVKGSRMMHMEQVVEALSLNGVAPGAGQDSVKQARVEA